MSEVGHLEEKVAEESFSVGGMKRVGVPEGC